MKCLTDAAEIGSPKACYMLSEIYAQGIAVYVNVDMEASARWADRMREQETRIAKITPTEKQALALCVKEAVDLMNLFKAAISK